MFDHAIFNDCMANVDFCEQMVKDTNPTLRRRPRTPPVRTKDIHGYNTIADIMRSLTRLPAASTRRRCRWRGPLMSAIVL